MAPLVANPGDAGTRLAPRESRPVQLLTRYLQALEMGAAIDSMELSRAVAEHICDLVALSVGAHRDATALVEQRGVRAARLRAVKADIAANLNDFELNVSTVAVRHGVTPRYIHKLFENDGATFSEYVLEERLAEVHRSLTDPHVAHRSVSTIAFDAGFNDLSYFNRAFRRRFRPADGSRILRRDRRDLQPHQSGNAVQERHRWSSGLGGVAIPVSEPSGRRGRLCL
jgi:AraC-like DNA-binding protein